MENCQLKTVEWKLTPPSLLLHCQDAGCARVTRDGGQEQMSYVQLTV